MDDHMQIKLNYSSSEKSIVNISEGRILLCRNDNAHWSSYDE